MELGAPGDTVEMRVGRDERRRRDAVALCHACDRVVFVGDVKDARRRGHEVHVCMSDRVLVHRVAAPQDARGTLVALFRVHFLDLCPGTVQACRGIRACLPKKRYQIHDNGKPGAGHCDT